MTWLSEDTQRHAVQIIAWGSWATATVLVYLRMTDRIPINSTLAIVILIGAAIAAGQALSRMKLADTITGVFHAGMASAVAVIADTCVIHLENGDRHIKSAAHAEVIGWGSESLHGTSTVDLFPGTKGDRILNRIEAGFSVTTPVLDQYEGETLCRLAMAQLGDIRVITITPV